MPIRVLVGVVAALACGNGTTVPPDPDPEPTSLEVRDGDGQAGTVGEPLSMDPGVVVFDQDGDPLGGVAVSWSAGDGSAEPANSTTNTQGVATTAWTLGTAAGSQTLIAAVTGAGSVTISATAAPGPVTSVVASPDTIRFASLAVSDTVAVVAEDQYGNAITDGLTWSTRDAAVATVTGTDAGAGEVTAAGAGEAWVVVEAGSLSDSALVQVEPAAASVVMSPTSASLNAIGDTVQLDATVLDAGGSEMPGTSVTFESTAPDVVTVDDAGRAVSVAAGTANVVASFGSLSAVAEITSRQVAATVALLPGDSIGLAWGDTLRILLAATDSNGVDIPDPAADLTLGDVGVAALDGSRLTAASANGATVLTATLDGLEAAVDLVVSGDGFRRTWAGGHVGEEGAWGAPYNWRPAGPVASVDTLFVPAADHDPVLAASDTAASLTVESGATVDLGGATLRLTGDITAAGAVSTGTLELVGSAATACGTVPSLLLVPAANGAAAPVVTLTCDLTVVGTVRLIGGRIVGPGHTLRVMP